MRAAARKTAVSDTALPQPIVPAAAPTNAGPITYPILPSRLLDQAKASPGREDERETHRRRESHRRPHLPVGEAPLADANSFQNTTALIEHA